MASSTRFSLLLLDHGEVLLESALAAMRMTTGEEDDQALSSSSALDGRLYLCTKSIFFEPKHESKPVFRFLYKQMGCEPKLSEAANSLVFRTRKLVEIRKHQPYLLRQLASSSLVSCELKHTKASKFSTLIGEVFASAAQPQQQQLMYDAVVLPRLREQFDRSRMVDFREQVVLPRGGGGGEVVVVEKIEPLVTVYGSALLTDQRVYFQYARLNNPTGQARQCLHWNLADVELVNKRRYLMQEVGLELVVGSAVNAPSTTNNNNSTPPPPLKQQQQPQSILLSFQSTSARDEFHARISELLLLARRNTTTPAVLLSLEEYTRQWQLREIDNFTYLERLNQFSDRSRMDLTQYPVFPWVLQDYTSTELDLTNAQSFRDLGKPIGALNEKRLEQFKARYNEMLTMHQHHGDEDEDDGTRVIPFLYGTHYSTPGFVLFYLIRQRADEALRLQNGKFDSPDRMFASVQQCWYNCLHSSSDVKELIPEFYEGKGEFLLNSLRLEFGKRSGGQQQRVVNDVELPPWANHSPAEFVRLMRAALESEHVSSTLHLWIDLVFGVDQRNILKDNVFYHLTYPPPATTAGGSAGVAVVVDEVTKRSNEAQIMEFGQTPKQLFSQKHPARNHHYEDIGVMGGGGGVTSPALVIGAHPTDDDFVDEYSSSSYAGAVDDDAGKRTTPTTTTTPPPPPPRQRWPIDLKDKLTRKSSTRVDAELPHAVGSTTLILDACLLDRMMGDEEEDQAACAVLACGDGSLQFLTAAGHVSRRVRLGKLALSSVVVSTATTPSLSSAGGGDLLVGSWDNSMCRYSVSTGRVLFRVDSAHDDAVSGISAVGGLVASCSWDSSVKLWQQEVCVNSFYSHPCAVLCVDLLGGDALTVSSDEMGNVHVHDQRVRAYDPVWQASSATSAPVERCAWLGERRVLCSSKRDGLMVYDTRMAGGGSYVTRVQMGGWSPTCFVTDGVQALVGDATGRVTLAGLDSLEHIPFESNVVLRGQGPMSLLRMSSRHLLCCSGGGGRAELVKI